MYGKRGVFVQTVSRSLSQLSNVDRSLERLVTEGCGQIGIKLDRATSTIDFRIWYSSLKLLPSAEAHWSKDTYYYAKASTQ